MCLPSTASAPGTGLDRPDESGTPVAARPTARQSRCLQVVPLDPSTYRRHALHGEERVWGETNCYTDLVIELAHGLGFEPLAMLAFTLAIDFEGDQWTFFKPPACDLADLYGVELNELSVWRPLVEHVAEQVEAGRPVLVELDSWFLPDTAATSYRAEHVKTTIIPEAIDRDAQVLRYFHNAGLYELRDADYRGLFRIDPPAGLIDD